MTDGTKALVGTIAALFALVAMFAIMADCSKHVANVEADPHRVCLEVGGWWSDSDIANHVGHCVKQAQK